MTSGHGLSEAARPFSAGEGPRGVLLIHGFGGTPASMRPWAAHLERHGYAVSVPLLPGHGTAWQDMARPRWTDWFTAVDGALSELRERCETTAVAGISMGAALALLLAVERPRDVSALLLVNPRVANAHRLMFAVPVLQHVIPSIAGDTKPVKKPGVPRVSYERLSVKAVRQMMLLWKELRPRLSEVTQPVIIWRSVADGPAGTLSSEVILGEVRAGAARAAAAGQLPPRDARQRRRFDLQRVGRVPDGPVAHRAGALAPPPRRDPRGRRPRGRSRLRGVGGILVARRPRRGSSSPPTRGSAWRPRLRGGLGGILER